MRLTQLRPHATVVCKSHRVRDLFRTRYWVMCARSDHEGPFCSRDDASHAATAHGRRPR